MLVGTIRSRCFQALINDWAADSEDAGEEVWGVLEPVSEAEVQQAQWGQRGQLALTASLRKGGRL